MEPLLLTAGIFGLQMPEMILILIVVLVIFGPKSLPQLGRAMGRGLREFKDASSKLSNAIEEEAEQDDRKAQSQKTAESRVLPPAAPPNTVATMPPVPPDNRS